VKKRVAKKCGLKSGLERIVRRASGDASLRRYEYSAFPTDFIRRAPPFTIVKNGNCG
jgi:hypothetical protein